MPASYFRNRINYTLSRVWENERAVIERNVAAVKWGTKEKAEWEPFLTVKCVFPWWRTEGARSTAREYAEPERAINLVGGVLIVPLGTEATDEDRIGKITTKAGVTLIPGPLRIVSVLEYPEHLELNLWKP